MNDYSERLFNGAARPVGREELRTRFAAGGVSGNADEIQTRTTAAGARVNGVVRQNSSTFRPDFGLPK